jgi:hypothetical protein
MHTHLATSLQTSLKILPFSAEKYEIRDLVGLFYKSSHKNSKSQDEDWIRSLEMQLERLKRQLSLHGSLCCTLQSKWSAILNKLIQAVTQFEVNYKANCPCASALPSPFIKRLYGIQQNAVLTLLYMEV